MIELLSWYAVWFLVTFIWSTFRNEPKKERNQRFVGTFVLYTIVVYLGNPDLYDPLFK